MSSEGLSHNPNAWMEIGHKSQPETIPAEDAPSKDGRRDERRALLDLVKGNILVTIKEFLKPEWEYTPHIMKLSGLSKEEIDQLPKNDLATRFFTAILRATQIHSRSYADRDATSWAKTTEGVQEKIEAWREAKGITETIQKKLGAIDSTPFVVKMRNGNSMPFDRIRNDMQNPFNPESDLVYSTEYAQLVNLCARKSHLKPMDVLKTTVLAAIQVPYGLMRRESKRKPNEEILEGRRIPEENKSIHQNPSLIFGIPLTQERIRDPEFLQGLNWEYILNSPSLRYAMKITPNVFFKGEYRK
jgi:hypothetical protein